MSMRILVIRRDNIGDLVCTTPLFAALRARYPDAHIAALVNSYNAPVLEGNPNIDAVHVYTKLKHRLPGQSAWRIILARLRMLKELRREAFDCIVLASAGFNRHALRFARQLRRRDVVGFADGDESGARQITTKVPVRRQSDLHEVQTLGLLARAMGVPEADGPMRIYPDRARVAAWLDRIPELRGAADPWVAVHVSARKPPCQWPAGNWILMVRRLLASGVRVILVWAPGAESDPRHPGDDDKAADILAPFAGDDRVRAARTSTLAELIAVLSLCRAFVGGDGGAMHIAAALGLPTLALFDHVPQSQRHWHPWKVPHEIVASRSAAVCDATVDELSAAWERLTSRVGLAARTRGPSPAGVPAPG